MSHQLPPLPGPSLLVLKKRRNLESADLTGLPSAYMSTHMDISIPASHRSPPSGAVNKATVLDWVEGGTCEGGCSSGGVCIREAGGAAP